MLSLQLNATLWDMSVEAPNSTSLPGLYREFSRQNTRVHNWLLPPLGVVVAESMIVLAKKFVGNDEFIQQYAPAIALAGMLAVGVTFAGSSRRLRRLYEKSGEIALEIAKVEGRKSQDPKSEISRARGVLKYKKAINRTTEFDFFSEAPVPIHSLGWKIKSSLDRFKGFILKPKWVLERDAAENPFYPAQHRGVLFESAVELSFLEWQLIENDPQKSDQERTHAANMFLAIRRLRGRIASWINHPLRHSLTHG